MFGVGVAIKARAIPLRCTLLIDVFMCAFVACLTLK